MQKLRATNVATVLFLIFFTILFLVLFGRLIYIQASGEVEGVNLDEWADRQRTTSYELPAERGHILDRTGMVLAANRPVYHLYAVLDEEYTVNEEEPLHVTDPVKTARELAPYLNMDEMSLSDFLSTSQEEGKWQVEFATVKLTEEQKEEIESLHLPGVYFKKELERYYPNSTFASHVIGFTQKEEEGSAIVGAMGIEKSFNDALTGKNGKISYKRDRFATKLLDPEETVQQAEDGDHVYLTIDQKIQTFLEDAMSDVAEQYEPKKIMAVVMNPKTGEVLALSNRPSFDPNDRSNITNWYNDVIANPIEPGSTMKIFTVAAAMDSGNYNGAEVFESGTYRYMEGVYPVHDHNWGIGWDYITYDEGFIRSSNVAMAKLVWEKMGPDTFLDYLKRFHFDQETGIDLTGEQIGTIMYQWPSEKVTTSFGQGTTLTAMQLMKAATAVVNNGKMMKPYIISKIVDSSTGEIIENAEPEVVGEPISPETAKQIRDLSERVISNEKGTGHNVYNLPDYSVAGKTGTSQIVDPETGKYMKGRENYIFSFLGWAPADEPELLMFVSVEQPKLEVTESGSEPVSYIFKTVMENSLHYLEVQPDKEEAIVNVEPYTLPDFKGKSIDSVNQQLLERNIRTKIVGNGGKVKDMIPEAGTTIYPSSNVLILTDGGNVMPDVTGWSLREVLQLQDLLNINITYEGNGYVVNQNIAPYTDIAGGESLIVKLQPPNEEMKEENEEEGEIQDE